MAASCYLVISTLPRSKPNAMTFDVFPPMWHPFAENWSIISFPRFRESEETRSHNGGGAAWRRVRAMRCCAAATNQSNNDNDICNIAARLRTDWSACRLFVQNRIILHLSHDSRRFTPQRSERRVYRSVKCKPSGNVNKTFNVVVRTITECIYIVGWDAAFCYISRYQYFIFSYILFLQKL